MYSRTVDKTNGVFHDQVSKLSGFYSSQQYPGKLRKVKYYDKDSNRVFVFLTNNFDLTALQIAFLYKNRWQIELFF